ncbi:MAG TPA: outer membrane beta-barrel protein [Hanamia sp.]|nr:outer membrane beta-barrel protein [Hanamia sp.]
MKKNQPKSNKMCLTRNVFKALFSGLLLLAFSNNAVAQKKWSIEARPGVNFVTKDLGDAKLKTGFGIEGTVNYRFMPHLSAYAGWGWNKFAADESFAGTKNDFEETGYTFGLQFIHPFETGKLSYLVEVGGIYNHIEVENNNGDIIADSGHGLGWQAGVGLLIPVGEHFSLTPAVRYRALSRNIRIGEAKTAVDLNYVSVGIGLSWSF